MKTLQVRSMRRTPVPSLEGEAAARHIRLCADVSRFLIRLLGRVPLSTLRYTDRCRLDRLLVQLGNRIAITRATLTATDTTSTQGARR